MELICGSSVHQVVIVGDADTSDRRPRTGSRFDLGRLGRRANDPPAARQSTLSRTRTAGSTYLYFFEGEGALSPHTCVGAWARKIGASMRPPTNGRAKPTAGWAGPDPAWESSLIVRQWSTRCGTSWIAWQAGRYLAVICLSQNPAITRAYPLIRPALSTGFASMSGLAPS